MRQYCGEEGVSEVVAAVLLIGLTVLGVAIVAAIFLSSPQPEEIPHVAIVAGNWSGNLALTHEGGDPLKVGEYRIYGIYADNENELQDVTDWFTEPPGGIWSIGETLVYNDMGMGVLERVIVVSKGTETILAEPSFASGGKEFDPDPVVPEDPEDPEEEEPIDIIIDENVFIYGSVLKFAGNSISGPNATAIITGGLNTNDLNQGASIAVSNLYFDGDVRLETGSTSLGSEEKPGVIYINGDLTLGGNRNLYGKVYVNGDCDLGGVTIHDEMYVNGDVILRQDVISFVGDSAHIYCAGSVTRLPGVDPGTLTHCTDHASLPEFTMPNLEMPSTKPDRRWYESKGYVSGGTLTDNKKIYAPSYSSPSGVTASNVIIIASDGDILITNGWSGKVTGVFFAPKGKVTFRGTSLEGLVIARDGFHVESGGTTVTFRNIQEYISNPEDYPF